MGDCRPCAGAPELYEVTATANRTFIINLALTESAHRQSRQRMNMNAIVLLHFGQRTSWALAKTLSSAPAHQHRPAKNLQNRLLKVINKT